MAVSWDTIRSLLLFFGPMLLPKAIGYYRQMRAGPAAQGLTIQPVPREVHRVLYLLGTSTLVYLLLSFPTFAPENLFVRTQSRLQIPTDVLFNRISSLRPDGALTASDTALRAKFVNLESRLLYLQFGPEVLADCPFCNSDDPRSYFYYAVPGLIFPHLVNLILLSVATSNILTGTHGNKWRTSAVISSAITCALDVYMVSSYRHQANARALKLVDMDHFFWNMRVYRWVALSLLNSVFAMLLYLSSTNRAFASPPNPAERVESVSKQILATKSRLNATTIVKNTILRDEELRGLMQAFWRHEGQIMREAMEDREVIDGVNDALQNRLNIQAITKDADNYAKGIFPPLPQMAPETTVD